MENNKICLINQPAGLGDILLCQKIASHYTKMGYDVVWPVVKFYDYISEYIKNDGVTFYIEDEDFPHKQEFLENQIQITQTDNFVYLPLQHADKIRIDSKTFLYAKYDFCELEPDNWLEYFELVRNKEREQKLIEHFEIDINEPYNVVNKTFATPPNTITNSSIVPKNDYKTINMEILGWDRIFDWMGVLENAKEIHTVDTSLTLILAKQELENVHIYERTNAYANYSEPNPNYVHKDLFCNRWNYYTSKTRNGF